MRAVEQDRVAFRRIHVGKRIREVGFVSVQGIASDLRRHRPLDDGRRAQEGPDFKAPIERVKLPGANSRRARDERGCRESGTPWDD